MQRSTLIKLHLYVAAFLVPFIFIMAITGVMELLDIKAETYKEKIFSTSKDTLNFNSVTIKQDVAKLLAKIGGNPDFDHLKIKKKSLYTRPTYDIYYSFKIEGDNLNIYQYTPDLQKKLMAFHKGNGPPLYKLYQKLFAFGLIFVLLSGLWLGLTSDALRGKTLLVFFTGCVFYLILINL